MKHLVSLLFVSLVATAACVDSRRIEPDDAASQVSEANSDLTSTGDGPKTDVTCQSIWECDPICGIYVNGVLVRYSTNVLHRECDDGSDTVIRADKCGEDCI